jgi:putative transposase
MLLDGARYHVSIRANRKEMILEADANKDLFLSVVKEATRRYSFRLENFCVMGNHVHFIIQPAIGESLSAIMQWIFGVFAMRFNRRFGLTGHVWGERFFSRIIADMKRFFEIFAYIDDNPREAGLVEKAQDWLYGRFHLNEIACEGLLASPPTGIDCP